MKSNLSTTATPSASRSSRFSPTPCVKKKRPISKSVRKSLRRKKKFSRAAKSGTSSIANITPTSCAAWELLPCPTNAARNAATSRHALVIYPLARRKKRRRQMPPLFQESQSKLASLQKLRLCIWPPLQCRPVIVRTGVGIRALTLLARLLRLRAQCRLPRRRLHFAREHNISQPRLHCIELRRRHHILLLGRQYPSNFLLRICDALWCWRMRRKYLRNRARLPLFIRLDPFKKC